MFGHQDTRRKDDDKPMENVMSDDTAAQVAAVVADATPDAPDAPAADFNPALPPQGHNPFAASDDATTAPAVEEASQPTQAEETHEEDPAQINIPVPVVGNEAYSKPGQVNNSPLSQHHANTDVYVPAQNETTPAPAPQPTQPTTGSSDSSNVLLDIKQQALTQLSPLVGHLEQSPEEKFRTTMMMIQANDDQSLIQSAYEAANAITDEKAKAQALLDIVNEINYFTHQTHGQQ